MYRIEIQSTASEPFSGFAEAQDAHIALVAEAELPALPERGDAEGARAAMVSIAQLRRSIRSFEWRLAATGKVIADQQQRSLAQSLLDYWALRHVELRDKAWQLGQADSERRRPPVRRSVSPRTLLPVDENLAVSLAETAEATYLALADDAQREKARQLFLAIANPYSSAWTIDPEVAQHFADVGVIVASGGTAGTRYALAHDSVAQQWSRLTEWIAAARDEEHQYELVLGNARNWSALHLEDSLPQGAALEQARGFAGRDPAIAEFVAAADAEELRTKRFTRGMATLIGLVGLAGVGYALYDNVFRDHEEPQAAAPDDKPTETVKAEGEQIDTVVPLAETTGKPTLGAAPTQCAVGGDFAGWIWIGSNGDSQVFDRGGKAIDPGGVAKDQQLSMRVWLNVRESMPPDDGTNIAGKVRGTASARAPAVALGNAVGLTVGDTTQYWLQVRLPTAVYVQVPEGAGEGVELVQDRLQRAGLEVPMIQRLPLAAALNEVRYYYEQDEARAQQVACLANEVLKPEDERNLVRVRSLVNTPLAANVRNGTIELWVFPPGVRNAQSPENRPAAATGRRRGANR